jgi:5-enolpyruvylshikimate-3-phosphate synthase
MLGAVAGLASREGVQIEDAEAVSVSFPGFFDLLEQLRATGTAAGSRA